MAVDRENIERGVAYLDTVDLEWRSRVDLETLDMRQDTGDVLAQVLEMSFYDAVTAATLSTGDSWADSLDRWAVEHGFTITYDDTLSEADNDRQWLELTEAWREEIQR